MAIGCIPDNLKVVLRKKIAHKFPGGPVDATAAVVTNAESKTSLVTAKLWAAGRVGYFNLTGLDTVAEPVIVEIKNDPIDMIRLVDMDERGQGGRAWKVVTQQGWLVDLREDVFLDLLFNKKRITPDHNGELWIRGPFQWIVNGSQMRLALVDSDLYREIAKSDVKRRLPKKGKIPTKDLVIGQTYALTSDLAKRSTWCHTFLGHVKINGKRSLAWQDWWFVNVSSEDRQTQFNRTNNDKLTFRGACGYTETLGMIKLSNDYKAKRFSTNGYGERIAPDTVEWL